MNMKRMMTTAVMTTILGGTCFVTSAYGEIVRPVPPAVIVESVKFRQRYPWNGLVDIDAKITCSDANTNLAVYVAAWDNVKDRALTVKTIWVEGDETKNPDPTVKSGMTRIVWDARADNPGEISSDVSVSVQAYVRDMRYLVIDLSDGPDAEEYQYSFMPDPPAGGWTDEYKTNKLVLRFIPAGTFLMGSPEDELGRNGGWECVETQHKVTLTRYFYVGVFEVTQKQYELVKGMNPSQDKGDARPVERLCYNDIRGSENGSHWPDDSLVDADTFLGRIRKRTDLVFDLPTEAQWEYACRAGTTTALNSGKNLTYYLKCDNMSDVGRYGQNKNDGRGGYSQHTTVGSYLANAWGIYDMHGNVAEWCRDWIAGDLGSLATVDPVGPSRADAKLIGVNRRDRNGYRTNYYPFRMMRGGTWYQEAACNCRSAWRGAATAEMHDTMPAGNINGYEYGEPTTHSTYNDWGFRVVVLPGGE